MPHTNTAQETEALWMQHMIKKNKTIKTREISFEISYFLLILNTFIPKRQKNNISQHLIFTLTVFNLIFNITKYSIKFEITLFTQVISVHTKNVRVN